LREEEEATQAQEAHKNATREGEESPPADAEQDATGLECDGVRFVRCAANDLKSYTSSKPYTWLLY
jgi:hypothetical protein